MEDKKERKDTKEVIKKDATELTDDQLEKVAGGIGQSFKDPDKVIPII